MVTFCEANICGIFSPRKNIANICGIFYAAQKILQKYPQTFAEILGGAKNTIHSTTTKKQCKKYRKLDFVQLCKTHIEGMKLRI